MKTKLTKTGKILGAIAGGLVIFGTGVGVGTSGASEGATATGEPRVITKEVEVPGPVRTKEVIKEVEVPGPTKTKTKTVTKEVTPAACIDALDLSGQAFAIASQQADVAGSAIMAVAEGDVALLESLTLDLEALNAELDTLADPLGAASAECRAKSGNGGGV